jgi:quercetin dioxygenase-like cupin family protein
LFPATAAEDTPLFRRAVLFENDEVQVLDLRYEPGSVTPLHTHEYPHRVLYIEAGGVLEILPGVKAADGTLSLAPDAEAKSVKLTAGQTLWLPAATHRLRNVGKTFVRVIEIEVKISDPKTEPKVE